MAGKYDDLAAQVVELVGGKSNVKSVAHCITRVRFKLKDESKANDQAISELPTFFCVTLIAEGQCHGHYGQQPRKGQYPIQCVFQRQQQK